MFVGFHKIVQSLNSLYAIYAIWHVTKLLGEPMWVSLSK